jgi:SAM-dependent methyltransferase
MGAATERMLDLVNLCAGDRVLDVAAGTGDQTLVAARRVGPSGSVLATDISASMLERAGEAARNAGLNNIETRAMDAESLELNESSFDAVICRLALMLLPNPVKALTEMRRVLKPGGKVSALVFSTPEKNPYHKLPLDIVLHLGNVSPPPPGTPGFFALAGPEVLADAYRRAGLRDVAVDAFGIRRLFPSTAEAVRATKGSYLVLRELMANLTDAKRELVWAEIDQELGQFEGPNGFDAPGEVLIGVGTK